MSATVSEVLLSPMYGAPWLHRPPSSLSRLWAVCLAPQVKAGMCCAHLGDMRAALEAFEALLVQSPADYGDLLLEVGDLLAANGQPQQVPPPAMPLNLV